MTPAFFSVKDKAQERYKTMPTESMEVPLHDEDGLREAVNTAQHGKYVVFLSVKAEAAVALSEKLRISHLESQDYENILKGTTETATRWDRLLKMIKLDPRHPKTPERILPDAYCDYLVSKKCEYYDISPKFYDLIIQHHGSVVTAECTKELQRELLSNGVL